MTDHLADSDFGTDPVPQTLAMLVRGVGRREVADELGVPLADVHRYVADGVRRRSGEAGTARESLSLLHAALDDVQRRAYAEMDRDVETTAPLLEVLLGTHRLRAGLLAIPKRQGDQ
jgi:hypothetical protein